MLLGHFLQQISQDLPVPAALDELTPGSVVVAVSDMQQLRETGLPTLLRFGIISGQNEVICQCCATESAEIPETPQFTIKKMNLGEFAGESARIYRCSYPRHRNAEIVAMAAKMHEGITYCKLRSYPGDDFVAECLTGFSAGELVKQDSKIGQHWWTPLQMTLQQSMKWLGVEMPAGWLPDSADVQVFDQIHHGIAIEGNHVIHFSTRRVPDGSNRIKADSLQEFRSIGDDEASGSAVKYKDETPGLRLTSRNRAVWVFCHADSWGAYNLMANNCEHFSRYCRTGRKESRQILAAALDTLGALTAILSRNTPFLPHVIGLRLLIKNVARLLGRPEPAIREELLLVE